MGGDRGDRHRRPRRARHARPGAVPRLASTPLDAGARPRGDRAVGRRARSGCRSRTPRAAVVRVAERQHGRGAARDLGRPRPRPAPVRAGRARRRRPDARLQVADELGIAAVLVIPRWPGITAALGLLGADVRHDLARGFVPPAGAALGTGDWTRCSPRSSDEVRPLLAGARSQLRVGRARHALPRTGVRADRAAAGAAGHRRHAGARRCAGSTPPTAAPTGTTTPAAPTEIVTVRCRATIALPAPAITEAPGSARPVGSRTVARRAPRRARPRVAGRDDRLAGPAIVEQEDSTITVPAGWTLRGAPGRHAAPGARMTIDPVTQEILNGAFSSIAEEMAVVEYRSSYSPIIREMLDFSCGIFDAAGPADRALRDDPGPARADAVRRCSRASRSTGRRPRGAAT